MIHSSPDVRIYLYADDPFHFSDAAVFLTTLMKMLRESREEGNVFVSAVLPFAQSVVSSTTCDNPTPPEIHADFESILKVYIFFSPLLLAEGI